MFYCIEGLMTNKLYIFVSINIESLRNDVTFEPR